MKHVQPSFLQSLSRSFFSGKIRRLTTITTLLTLGVFLATAHNIAAQDNDFGAETIEGDPAVVPVDLAEERALLPKTTATAQEAERGKSAAAAPSSGKESASGDESASLPRGEDDSDATAILNVKDVELAALVKSFSRLTKRNYIVDSNVKGKVTVHLATPVTLPDALRILDSVLLLKGFASVPVGPNTWKIIPAKEAKQTTIPTVKGDLEKPTDALVTQLIRLRYVKASDLQQTLSQFVSRDGVVTASTSTNALIVIDSAANIDRLADITTQLDVPALDQDITIVPVKHAEAKDLAEKLNELLGGGGSDDQNPAARFARAPLPNRAGNVPPNLGNLTPTSTSTSMNERRVLPFKILADERTNSIVVVADPETTLKVRALTEQLDSPVDRSSGRFWVYRLKHADAEALANVLGAVISGSGGAASDSSAPTTGSSLSRSSSRGNRGGSGGGFGGSNFGGGLGSSDRSQSSSRQNASAGSPVSVSGKVNFEGEVSIASDTSTNSLIINASKTDYLRLKEVVDQLDIKRRQVLVEATILEVSLAKDQGLGIEFQTTGANDNGGVIAQTNYGGLTNLLTNPAGLNDLTIAAASTGTLTLPGGLTIPSQALLISAVSSNQNVNVLSSPTILTTDNQEAEIIVGENVPFVTSTSSNETNLNNTFNQIERQDVGITLRITPQIGTGSWVSLRTFVEISNVVPTTRNDPNGPTTSIRTTETNVEVKSGQMIVTGGLIADSATESTRGVPFWEDIPVFGNFFRRDDTNRRRTNLLIFITPRVVEDQYEARDLTKERSGELSKTINQYQSEPNRREVLTREEMDRVTEVTEESQEESVSITPPQMQQGRNLSEDEAAAVRRTEQALSALSKTNRPEAADSIDLTVTPKLPTVPGKPAAAIATKNGSPELERMFVVLRNAQDGEPQTVGIIINGNNSTPGTQFFDVGQRYRKTQGKFTGEYICLGKYSSLLEAGRVHPEIADGGTWQTLSPQEILALGHSVWFKGNE